MDRVRFIKILKSAGIKNLEAPKQYFEIKKPVKFINEEKGIELIALPDDHYNITSMIDYDSPVLGKQFATLNKIEDRCCREHPCGCSNYVDFLTPGAIFDHCRGTKSEETIQPVKSNCLQFFGMFFNQLILSSHTFYNR